MNRPDRPRFFSRPSYANIRFRWKSATIKKGVHIPNNKKNETSLLLKK